jgi:hypothetical protein
MSLPKLLLHEHSCMYAKRGGVAAYIVVTICACVVINNLVILLRARYKCNHE